LATTSLSISRNVSERVRRVLPRSLGSIRSNNNRNNNRANEPPDATLS